MENYLPRMKTLGKGPSVHVQGEPPVPPLSDTMMVRATDTPDENDPLWEKLGKTDIGEASTHTGAKHAPRLEDFASPNVAEIPPSRVFGMNFVQLGDYRLLRKLGAGAMGEVYQAEAVGSKQIFALKVLFPHIASNQKLVERMLREGLVMGLLDHPNIIRAYGNYETDGCHYVAMEYVSGQSMQKWLLELGHLTVEDSVRVTLDCAKALAYAHANNVIHRDIKPDNILVTKNGIVKVADLGMAKFHDEDMSLTQTGHSVGTPWYMPLEQARNAKEIKEPSDIYALGCTLYAFLTGNPPFVGRTIVDVIQAKEVGRFPPARKFNAAVPAGLDLVLLKMTAKAAKDRYQNCDELIKALENLNLASNTLSFIEPRTEFTANRDDTPIPEGATVSGALVDGGSSGVEIPAAESQALEPGVWYVSLKMHDGTQSTTKYTTAQLKKMLAEGTMTSKTKISNSPNGTFRAIATYKEFQGTALSKASQQAADKSTTVFRDLYKKITDKERKREDEKTDGLEDPMRANTRYWLGILLPGVSIGAAVIVACAILYWLLSR